MPPGYIIEYKEGNSTYGNSGETPQAPAFTKKTGREYIRKLSEESGIPEKKFSLRYLGIVNYTDPEQVEES